MIDQYLNMLQENVLLPWPEVEAFRKKHKYMWLYHGTPLKSINIIKSRGLDPVHMGDYCKSLDVFCPGQPLYRKKVIWFTSSKKHASFFSKKTLKAELFKKYRGQVILAKVNTSSKYLIFASAVKILKQKTDEYMYIMKIPAKNILFSNDPKYYEIENKCTYLQS